MHNAKTIQDRQISFTAQGKNDAVIHFLKAMSNHLTQHFSDATYAEKQNLGQIDITITFNRRNDLKAFMPAWVAAQKQFLGYVPQ